MAGWSACWVSAVTSCGPADPAALTAWYRGVLGLELNAHGQWQQQAGPTVFAAFPADTDYFGPTGQPSMVNLRVADLDAMLEQVRTAGAPTADEVQEMDGLGLFAWVTDPEGNRIELWQPA